MSQKDIQLKENFRDFQTTLPDTFKCSECPAKFRYRGSLNVHYQSVHQKVKCDQCNKFMAQGNLAAHKLCHQKGTARSTAAPGRYKCDECPSTFTRTSSLNEHKRNIHEGVQVVCNGCSTVLKNQGTFKKHVCENRDIKQQKLQVKKNKLIETLGQLAPWENFVMDLTMPALYRLQEEEVIEVSSKIIGTGQMVDGKYNENES